MVASHVFRPGKDVLKRLVNIINKNIPSEKNGADCANRHPPKTEAILTISTFHQNMI